MSLHRRVRIEAWPLAESPTGDAAEVDLPDEARIVDVLFSDGVASAVLTETVIDRYDPDHPERPSIYDRARSLPKEGT